MNQPNSVADQKVYILSLLAENEIILSQLYLKYATLFPEKKAFWEHIAAEEVTHASILKVLGEEAANGKIYFDPNRYNAETIHFSIEYKRQKMIEATLPLYTYIRAISVAYTLEQAFLECRFFEVFDGDSAEFKQQMTAIKTSTEEHLREVKTVWEEANRNQKLY